MSDPTKSHRTSDQRTSPPTKSPPVSGPTKSHRTSGQRTSPPTKSPPVGDPTKSHRTKSHAPPERKRVCPFSKEAVVGGAGVVKGAHHAVPVGGAQSAGGVDA
ncbi:MAG: hypothetical protein FWB81_06545 [Cystobacterineae bacterium]|nr:hypothetical protein [Cystobacterineae bacterium]